MNSISSINVSTIASITSTAAAGPYTTKVMAIDDEPNDITTLRYGTKIILRGCLGKYLSAHYTEKEENSVGKSSSSSNVIGFNKTIATAVGSGGVYLLGVDGYGIGSTSSDTNNSFGNSLMTANNNNGITDCLTFIPIESENTSNGTTINETARAYDNDGDENNSNNSDDSYNVITYGSTVAIRADGARQRLLGK